MPVAILTTADLLRPKDLDEIMGQKALFIELINEEAICMQPQYLRRAKLPPG